jgi:hypothetical protein
MISLLPGEDSMAGADGDKGTAWQGGSLDDLLGLLAEGSWSARIEATRGPGRIGFIDVIAGGISESHAGDLRGDRALAALRAHPETSYRVEFRLPHPTLGGLEPPGDREGSLADRPVAGLMRYCEEFVLSGALLLTRDDHVARIVYRRGELATTVVDGSDDPDRLTDVMGWRTGRFVIDVEGPALPVRMPAPKPSAAPKEAPTTLFGYPTPGLAAAALGTPAGRATAKAPPAAAKESVKPAEPARSLPHDPASTRPTPRAPMPAVSTPASQRQTPRTGSAIPPSAVRPTPQNQPAQPLGKPSPIPAAAVGPAPTAPAPIPLSKTPSPRLVPGPSALELEPTNAGYLSQPLLVHVLVGAAVGALAVIGYWAYLRGGGTPLV